MAKLNFRVKTGWSGLKGWRVGLVRVGKFQPVCTSSMYTIQSGHQCLFLGLTDVLTAGIGTD